MAFSNLFAFMSGVICSVTNKNLVGGGAFNCAVTLGKVKEAISSDILISLVTSEMFLKAMSSILVMLLVAVIAVVGVAIIKNGQNELPKMKKSGDSFFKRVLRIFLIALIVPVMAISGIGVDGNLNVRKGFCSEYLDNLDTDLYSGRISFNGYINDLKSSHTTLNEELFGEGEQRTFYINSEGKEIIYYNTGDYEVTNDYTNRKVLYGSKGEGPQMYERACLESTKYEVTTGFGGNYGYDGNTVSGFFVRILIDRYFMVRYSTKGFHVSPGYAYFFVKADANNKEAYYYYFTKHLGLDIVACDFDNAKQSSDFESYSSEDKTFKPLELQYCTNDLSYILNHSMSSGYSGLMGFINYTRGNFMNMMEYGLVSNFTEKDGTVIPGCYFTFKSKGLMTSGGFFANEAGSSSDCMIYINDVTNGNYYSSLIDYAGSSEGYSYVYSYGGAENALIYKNWNTVKYALQFTSRMPTGGSGRKVRDPLTAEEIAEYYAAKANAGNNDTGNENTGSENTGSEHGSGQNYSNTGDDNINKKVNNVAVATYKRFIGIVNTLLPYEIGFVLALAMFYGLNVALRYARADEVEDKKKAKQKLINIVVGAIIAIVLTSIIILILNGDFIINILESMK